MNSSSKIIADKWLEGVFEQFEAPLLRYVARFLVRHDLAQDVVQDAFVKLCHQDPDALGTSVGAWLFRVCRNRALDVLKKERRMQPMPTHDDSAIGSASDPAESAEQCDAARSAVRVLRTLPDRQQEVIRLKIEHGLSYREIGDVLGLTASNVGYILHHSIKALREQLIT
jgi:RNA polymerase sigma-70 factor (ECF subfamily)